MLFFSLYGLSVFYPPEPERWLWRRPQVRAARELYGFNLFERENEMLKEKMLKALNVQINEELYSSYLYLAMAAAFETKGLKGFANWMQIQVQEELAHAKKLFGYVNERMGRVELLPLDAPPVDWDTPLKIFESVCRHEEEVSEKINHLFDIAVELKDHATSSYLQWYVNEQVEEVSNAHGILDRMKIAGEDGHALLLLDNEMGQRVFVNPLSGGE